MRKFFVLCTAFLLTSSLVFPNLHTYAETSTTSGTTTTTDPSSTTSGTTTTTDPSSTTSGTTTTTDPSSTTSGTTTTTDPSSTTSGTTTTTDGTTVSDIPVATKNTIVIDSTIKLFPDVGTTHRAQLEIYYLVEGNIIKGRSDGLFYPDHNVTRAEAAAMVGRALDLNGTKRATAFKDVGSSEFASGYIQSAVDKKIISGYSDGTFKPDQAVTRGEMAILIYRALKLGDVPVSTQTAANTLIAKGIAQGMSNGTFGEGLHIKRSDFSVFLARAINLELRLNQTAYPVIDQETVTADFLNVRKGPLTAYSTIGQFSKGTKVNVLERVGNWALVQANEVRGFVYTGFLVGASLNQFIQSQTIVIDPGHGGSDPGAIANGLHEDDVTLAVGLKVKSLFSGSGFNLAMTRESSVYPTLGDRVAFAKQVGANVFLSIHANSGPSSASGTETYYYSAASTNPYVADSKLLATCLQKRMVEAWNLPDRGVKIGDLYVLRENSMPAALLELGFITNTGDAFKLSDSVWQDRAAKAIYLGILDYYQAKTGLDFGPLYKRVQ